MPRQIVLRDELYQRLWELKGDHSFSWVIEKLLEGKPIEAKVSVSELLQVLRRQNQVLEEILGELRALNKRLSTMKLEVRSVKVGSDVTGVTCSENLPSYLRDNPWVGILQKRVGES